MKINLNVLLDFNSRFMYSKKSIKEKRILVWTVCSALAVKKYWKTADKFA